jgi:hypothetical protein
MGGGLMPDNLAPSSMGGAVVPGLAGEGFADGGMPGMPNMGGMPGVMGYVPAANLPIGKLMTANPKLLQQNKSGLASAVETGKGIAGLYDMGKAGLVGSAATSSSGEMPGLIGGGGKFKGENVFDWTKKQFAANGGLIVPRHGYAMGGGDDEEPTPYNPSEVMSGEDPMKDVLRSGSQFAKSLPKPGGGGGGGGGQSGASQLSSALGLGTAAMNFGSTAAEFLPEMAMMFLADGGRTPFAYGGLISRQHHADGDRVIAKNTPEEAGLVVPADGGDGDQATHDPNVSFEKAVGNLLRREGGLGIDNNQARVNFGINQASHPEVDVRKLTKESAAQKYRDEYWATIGGDKLHPDFANVALDTAAMAGPSRAKSLMQSSGGDPVEMLHQRQKFLASLVASGRLNDDGTLRYGPQVAKSWQNRYESMLGELGAKPQINLLGSAASDSPRPPGVMGRSERTPSSYSGKGAGEASLGDVFGEYVPQGTPTSANFWVPALAGLGSMLASKNPTLLGAVGEGLVGGVSEYQSQQKQQMEMARDLRTMLDQRFTAGTIPGDSKQYGENAGKPGYFDTNLRTWLTVDQMIKGKAGIAGSLGIAPALLGVPELPKLQPVTTQKQQQTEQQKPEEITQKSEGAGDKGGQPKIQVATEAAVEPGSIYELSTTQLADRIRQGGDKAYREAGLVGALDPRPIEKRMTDNQRELDNIAQLPDPPSQKRAGELRALLTTDSDTVAKLYDRATNLQSEKNKKEAENQMAQHNTHMEGVNKRMAGYQIGEKDILSLANIYKDYEAGRASNLTAALKSWATSVGMGGMLPANFDTLSNDAASKIVTKMGTDYMVNNGLLRAPAAINMTTQKMTPGPTLDPGAVFILMGSQLGELRRQNAEDRAYSESGTRDVNKFLRGFSDDKTKNLDVFVAASMSELPAPKGITQQQLSKLSQDYHFVPQGQDPHELGKVQENRKLGLGKVLVPTKDGKTVELFYKLDRGQ